MVRHPPDISLPALFLRGTFCLLLSPFASAIGPVLLGRLGLAVGVVAALLLAAVSASRSLVRPARAEVIGQWTALSGAGHAAGAERP